MNFIIRQSINFFLVVSLLIQLGGFSSAATASEIGQSPSVLSQALMLRLPFMHRSIGEKKPLPGISEFLIRKNARLYGRVNASPVASSSKDPKETALQRLQHVTNILRDTAIWLTVVILLVVSFQETGKDIVVIDGITVPKSLEDQGFKTPQTVANHIADNLHTIYYQMAEKALGTTYVTSLPTNPVDVEIPETKFSVDKVIELVRKARGKKTFHVNGDVSEGSIVIPEFPSKGRQKGYRLVLRISEGMKTEVLSGAEISLSNSGSDERAADAIFMKAAEAVLQKEDPYMFAYYTWAFKRDSNGAIELLKSYGHNSHQFSMAYALWGQILSRSVPFSDPMLVNKTLGILARSIRLDPNNPAPHETLAFIYLDQNNDASAEGELRNALRLDPSNTNLFTGLIQLLEKQKRYREAESLYRKAVGRDPTYKTAYGLLVNALEGQGDIDGAIKVLKGAETTHFNDRFLHLNLARLLETRQRFQEAIDEFEDAIQLEDVDDFNFNTAGLRDASYLKWARLLEKNGKHDEAVHVYQTLLNKNPRQESAYAEWAQLLLNQKRYKEAIEKASHAPNVGVARLVKGKALAAQGFYQAADKELFSASIFAPKLAEIYEEWGRVLLKLGRTDEAREKFQTAKELRAPKKIGLLFPSQTHPLSIGLRSAA